MTEISVSVSDFPGYDGSSSPDDFLKQCTRLATLGKISSQQCVIIAAKCRGRALAVINGIEDCGDELSLTVIKTQLRAHFGTGSSVEQAAQNLSSLVKGGLPAHDYGLKVKQLVRQACPEFFNENGQVKTICAPSYKAALYRHFLTGLSVEEKRLLSRLKATTFDECLAELTREENLQSEGASSAVTVHRVRWHSLDSPGRESVRGRWSASPDRCGRWTAPAGGSPPEERSHGGPEEWRSGPAEGEHRRRWSSPAPGERWRGRSEEWRH